MEMLLKTACGVQQVSPTPDPEVSTSDLMCCMTWSCRSVSDELHADRGWLLGGEQGLWLDGWSGKASWAAGGKGAFI